MRQNQHIALWITGKTFSNYDNEPVKNCLYDETVSVTIQL